jgi:hypothetical protein
VVKARALNRDIPIPFERVSALTAADDNPLFDKMAPELITF